ncbi:unnamed protein product [Gordionus sp. m RMFG-2023]
MSTLQYVEAETPRIKDFSWSNARKVAEKIYKDLMALIFHKSWLIIIAPFPIGVTSPAFHQSRQSISLRP